MKEFPRPVVVVSGCLEFESCRWNGLMITSPAVKALKPYVEFVPVCPEAAIGLGVPRAPIRIVESNGGQRLVQPDTGREVTVEMTEFSGGFLTSLGNVDGFILKDRSPSCGVKDVRVYPSAGKEDALHGRGTGLFAQAVAVRYGHLAVETEARLYDSRMREHFLTKLYALAAFRVLKKDPSVKELVRFHSENKYLLMAYNQSVLKNLGRVAANRVSLPPPDLFDTYDALLRRALGRPPHVASIINVLQHCLGYFRGKLEPGEKSRFLERMELYREGRLPLVVLNELLYSWAIRFEEEYLATQTFFNPYPGILAELEAE